MSSRKITELIIRTGLSTFLLDSGVDLATRAERFHSNEPGAAHDVGRSLEVARMFFEDVLSARVAVALQPMLEKDDFVADLKTKTFHRARASAPRSFDGVASY